MFCPHCGSKILDGRSTCQSCGQETIDLSGEVEAQVVGSGAIGNCLNCGAPLGQDELFCGQCGTRVSTDPSSETSLAAPPITRGRASPRRTRVRSAPPDTSAWEASWPDAPSDRYNAPTQAHHRSQAARPALRSAPVSRTRSRPVSPYTLADQPYLTPPRSHIALIIGLLCFLASFLSAGAAVWLAVTALH